MRDAKGRLLDRKDLQNPELFAQAISDVPAYPSAYTYENFSHVHLAKIPILGNVIRRALDFIFPGWEEKIDWSLLLERESLLVLVVSASVFLFLLTLRAILAWIADHRLSIPRFHLWRNLVRAFAALFTTLEIKS